MTNGRAAVERERGREGRTTGVAMTGEGAANLSVVIDADNAQPGTIEALLAEVAKCGTAHVKRAYGDWTGTNLKGPVAGPVDPSCPAVRVHERQERY